MAIYVRQPDGTYVRGLSADDIRDGAITYAKLADDAKVKYKGVSGYTAVEESSTVTLASISVDSGEFSKGFIILAIAGICADDVDYGSYANYYLYVDGNVVESYTNWDVVPVTCAMTHVVTDGGSHTIELEVYNENNSRWYFVQYALLIIGI